MLLFLEWIVVSQNKSKIMTSATPLLLNVSYHFDVIGIHENKRIWQPTLCERTSPITSHQNVQESSSEMLSNQTFNTFLLPKFVNIRFIYSNWSGAWHIWNKYRIYLCIVQSYVNFTWTKHYFVYSIWNSA